MYTVFVIKYGNLRIIPLLHRLYIFRTDRFPWISYEWEHFTCAVYFDESRKVWKGAFNQSTEYRARDTFNTNDFVSMCVHVGASVVDLPFIRIEFQCELSGPGWFWQTVIATTWFGSAE